jgi:hypothetical protein
VEVAGTAPPPAIAHKIRAAILWIVISAASWMIASHDGVADEPRRPQLALNAEIQGTVLHEFERHDPSYLQERETNARKLAVLTERLIALQKEGKHMTCSEQILIESRWLLESTTNWRRFETHLDRLRHSMETADQDFAQKQSAKDGSWGACYEEWFLKLDASVTALNDLADRGQSPSYPLSFLDRIRNPEVLRGYLGDLLISDVADSGIDHRDELGAVTGALSQLLFKDQLRPYVSVPAKGFVIDRQYVEAYRQFLDASQDPSTGYWGAWYRVGEKLYMSADLSLTFHTISYLDGKVRFWPRIIDTTLAVKSLEYPYGWMKGEAYNHHNNYDVVKILRSGWLYMSGEQKERSRAELAAMLVWCLQMRMDPRIPFAVDASFYSDPGDYYYYGVSFIEEIGYWDRSKRFWTSQDYPDALELCRSIKARLLESKLDTPPARAARQKLEKNCP